MSVPFFAQENLLKEGQNFYKKGNYEEAALHYDSLLKQGYYSPALYYNAANAYYKKGDLGLSRLYYEKALKWSPHDKDIIHNIALIDKKIDSEIAHLPDFFLLRWWKQFSGIFSLDVWLFFTFLFAIGIIAGVVLLWFVKNDKYHRWGGILIIVSVFLFFLALMAALTVNNRIYHNKNAVVVRDQAVFSTPATKSEKLYDLKAGEKVKLIDSLTTWYKVQLLNKETGWMPKETLKKI